MHEGRYFKLRGAPRCAKSNRAVIGSAAAFSYREKREEEWSEWSKTQIGKKKPV